MKLVHVTTVPISFRFLLGQVGYMKEKGLDVAAISSPGPFQEEFSRLEGVPVYAVNMPRRITPVQDMRAVKQLAARFADLRPDIVHSHTPKGGLLGMLAAKRARVPARVYHMRGLPFQSAEGPKRRLLQATERVSCRLADLVICVSHSVRGVAVESGLCPPDKIKVLLGGSGNGVDAIGRFNPALVPPETRNTVREAHGIPRDALVVGFVGRIVRDKGLVELTGAWRRLRAEHPGAHLMVLGPFEPQDPIPAEAEATLRNDERIHLVGTDWNVVPYYAAMDILCLPTYREGFPNVLLEASAMRLPVVATSVPGCVDAVDDGKTGLLACARDISTLHDALSSYAGDPEMRARHGDAGREWVLREFRQEGIWSALYDSYAQLLERSGIKVSVAQPAPVSREPGAA